jgi:hypothetical protein
MEAPGKDCTAVLKLIRVKTIRSIHEHGRLYGAKKVNKDQLLKSLQSGGSAAKMATKACNQRGELGT